MLLLLINGHHMALHLGIEPFQTPKLWWEKEQPEREFSPASSTKRTTNAAVQIT
jgi:hypothetical protein